MATFQLAVKPRENTGKGAARKLRATEQLPAVLYGTGREPLSLSIGEQDLRDALATDARDRVLLQLNIDGAKGDSTPALIKEIQRHPVRGDFLHADLWEVRLDKPVEIRVPVRGEGVPIGVKNEGGVLEWIRRDITILVLPDKIPARIDVDLSDLALGQSITAEQMVSGGDLELAMDPKTPICHVAVTRMSIDVVEVEGEEGVEGEAVEGDETPEDGAPAEGEKAPEADAEKKK